MHLSDETVEKLIRLVRFLESPGCNRPTLWAWREVNRGAREILADVLTANRDSLVDMAIKKSG